MAKGYVYILTNPCIHYTYTDVSGEKKTISPVKIGMAKNLEQRLGSLNTSLPENFVHHMSVGAEDAKALENVVHRILDRYRILTKNRERTEFFTCSIEEAKEALKQTAKDMHLKEYKIDKSKMVGRSAHGIKANAKARAIPVVKIAHEKKFSAVKEMWKSKTELARLIARRAGCEGAKDGVAQYFAPVGSKVRKPCHPGSKWREPLENAGVRFDKDDFVSDWTCAKNPL